MSHEINLYDASLRAVRDPFSLRTLVIAVVVCAGFILGGHLLARDQVSAARAAAAAREASVLALSSKLVEDTKALSGRSADEQLQQRLDAYQADLRRLQLVSGQISDVLKDQAKPFADVLRALARRHTDGVWLMSVEISRGAALSRLQGLATHEALIPDYISGLRQEAALAGLSFAHLNIEAPRSELQDNKAAQPADQVRNFVLSSEPPGANPAALTELSR